jgi:hypothetical protein
VHAGCTTLSEIGSGRLGLSDTLGEDGSILVLDRVLVVARKPEDQEEKRTAASLVRSELRRLSAMRWRLCWRRWGVTRRWIFGALVYGFLPSPFG